MLFHDCIRAAPQNREIVEALDAVEEGVEVTPLFARPASRNAVLDLAVLHAGRLLFAAFLKRDLVPLDRMNLRIEGALASGGPLGVAARWLLAIPGCAAGQPDDLHLPVVQTAMEYRTEHAETQV